MQENAQMVYHLVPKGMAGETLYPLNRLQHIYPELAELHTKKYVGREQIMQTTVPPLNCLWNDVLMFSPVSPDRILQTFEDEGFKIGPTRWFEIPLERLAPPNTAVYFPKLRKYGEMERDANQFTLLTDVDFESLTTLPELFFTFFELDKAVGRRPFMFNGIPHILYKGEIALEGIKIIEM